MQAPLVQSSVSLSSPLQPSTEYLRVEMMIESTKTGRRLPGPTRYSTAPVPVPGARSTGGRAGGPGSPFRPLRTGSLLALPLLTVFPLALPGQVAPPLPLLGPQPTADAALAPLPPLAPLGALEQGRTQIEFSPE